MILAVKCRGRKRLGCRRARRCRWRPNPNPIPGRPRGSCRVRRIVVEDLGFDADEDEEFDADFDEDEEEFDEE